MTDNTMPYLCGGIFFSLLSKLKLKGSASDKVSGKYRGISDVELMSNLHYVITGAELNNQETLPQSTSKYRNCKTDGGEVIPFSTEQTIKGFDELVRTKPEESINRMKQLAKDCLDINNEYNAKWLIESILRIIHDDDTIDDLREFYILKGNQPVSKKNMILQKDFDFYPFLIGVLHYIITKPTDNTKGQETYKKLFPNRGRNGSGKVNTDFLTPLGHNISVRIDKQDITDPPKIEDDIIASHPKVNQCIKFLYRSKSLEKWEEDLITNFDSSIIDLNENPEGYHVNDEICIICRLTSDFQFSSYFDSARRTEMVKIDFTLGNESVFDFTSLSNWNSESEIRKILFRGQYNCTAWVRIESQPNKEYFTKILAVGKFR